MGEALLELEEIDQFYKRYKHPRIDERRLIHLLSKPPPRLERVSLIEVYKLNDEGRRIRRICGQLSRSSYPTFVPEGIPNPHGVINPRRQYLCCNHAGARTDHKGVGPCALHQFYRYNRDGNRWFGRYYNFKAHFKELIRDQYLNGQDMPDDIITGKDAMEVINGTEKKLSLSFDGYLDKIKKELDPEELVDSFRLLYELEAHRAMLKDRLEASGEIDPDAIEQISNNILKMAQFQASVAKRDEHIMKAKAIQAICQVFITGVLAVINEEIGNKDAIKVLKRIKEEVVLPTNEKGYTEMLRRQYAAGLNRVAERIAVEAEEADIVDLKYGEEEEALQNTNA